MKSALGNLIRANKLFKMIQDKDRICVGVSGGKDSMLLLQTLSLYKKIVKKELNWDIDVVGIHLRMNLCFVDYQSLIDYWKSKEIEFHVVDTVMDQILKNQMKKGKIQCSLCSKMKKAILIDSAKKYNCNKVAMGHHADDAIETFFMNLINEGRVATFKPKMYLDRSQIWFIRPFILARENEISKEAKKIELPVIPCGCPMEGFTQRDSMKDFLKNSFYKNPKWQASFKNFLIALLNGKECDLWFIENNDNFPDLVTMIKNDKNYI
ncbi:MAG: tRNA 2-thiocytidine biosynthesis TtcA family protein [Malacoplasma sp.]|nr:tRNA 2-thiocytidine biosynthesis TtcA family protein [Malacoplasma sp.]